MWGSDYFRESIKNFAVELKIFLKWFSVFPFWISDVFASFGFFRCSLINFNFQNLSLCCPGFLHYEQVIMLSNVIIKQINYKYFLKIITIFVFWYLFYNVYIWNIGDDDCNDGPRYWFPMNIWLFVSIKSPILLFHF